MSNWNSPLLGRRVKVERWTDGKIIAKAKHWWQSDKKEPGQWVWEEGEVVDRASNCAEYLIAFDDGKLDWYWSSSLRLL